MGLVYKTEHFNHFNNANYITVITNSSDVTSIIVVIYKLFERHTSKLHVDVKDCLKLFVYRRKIESLSMNQSMEQCNLVCQYLVVKLFIKDKACS